MSDRAVDWPVSASRVRAEGPVITMVTDDVTTPGGETIRRDYVRHPGSVAILALAPGDDGDEVVCLRQYRHPVRHELLELPAGLLDEAGEAPVDAARRELAEEVNLRAERWSELAEFYASPGCSDELIRVFLAEGLSPQAEPEGFVREGEEAHMVTLRVPLAALLADVTAGRLHNPALVVGVLALAARRAGA